MTGRHDVRRGRGRIGPPRCLVCCPPRCIDVPPLVPEAVSLLLWAVPRDAIEAAACRLRGEARRGEECVGVEAGHLPRLEDERTEGWRLPRRCVPLLCQGVCVAHSDVLKDLERPGLRNARVAADAGDGAARVFVGLVDVDVAVRRVLRRVGAHHHWCKANRGGWGGFREKGWREGLRGGRGVEMVRRWRGHWSEHAGELTRVQPRLRPVVASVGKDARSHRLDA